MLKRFWTKLRNAMFYRSVADDLKGGGTSISQPNAAHKNPYQRGGPSGGGSPDGNY